MPQNVKNLILESDDLPEVDCEHSPLSCPWTINSKDENLTVIITCLKWTFNYDFRVRVLARPQGAPNISKQIDLDDHHPLLRSLTDAPNLCEAFAEPHLNTHQLDILAELIEYLDLKFGWNNVAHAHLACPVLALHKYSGTDADQDAQSFMQLIERKINFALGDVSADDDELAN